MDRSVFAATGRRRMVVALGLVLAAFMAMRPSLDNGYSFWDDQVLLSGETAVPRGPVRHVVAESFRPVPESAYYPLYRLSIATDLLLWGDGPLGHHLSSLVLHGLAVVLVFRLGLALFDGQREARHGAPLSAAVAGLLYAVHPLCVEPVAWICGRKVQVAVVFALLAFWCYLAEERHWAWRLPALIGFLAACLSNAVVTGFPLMLIGHELVVRRRRWWKAVLLRLDFVAVAAAAGTWRLLRVTVEPGALNGPWRLNQSPWSVADWLPVAAKALSEQTASVLWPLRLAHVYPVEIVTFRDWRAIMGAVLVGAFAIGVWRLRTRPLPAFFLLWFGCAMVPSVAHHIVRADRHLYFPLAGVCWSAGAASAALWHGWPKWVARAPVALAGVLSLGLLTLASRRQCAVWASPLALWTHALKVNPADWRICRELGLALTEAGRPAEAVTYLRRAVAAEPEAAIVRHNLARALVANGETNTAVAVYREALELDPTMAGAWNDLAVLLIGQGDLVQAEECCREALRQDPELVEALTNLADLHARRGDFEEAVSLLRKGLKAKPSDVTAASMLAQLLTRCSDARLRNAPEAVRLAERACRLTEWSNPDMLNTLAAAYAAVGSFERAVALGTAARDLARQLNRAGLAAEIEERLARYRAGQPLAH